MPFQPPSIMAACMILLAAPRLAAAYPSPADSDLALGIRHDGSLEQRDGAAHVVREDDELEPVPTEPMPTPVPTPGSTTPVFEEEPEPYFAFQGCYNEPKKGGRALANVWESDDMTPELCAEHAAGFAYYGLQYGKECWFGNTLRKGSGQRDETECQKPCAGDPEQTCGDGQRLNLYRRTDAHVPLDQPLVGDYHLQGCYTDSQHFRALTKVIGDDSMSPDLCAAFCEGSTYMGLEYGRECWCGEDLDITSFEAPLDQCQMPCAGDLGSMCGSPDRMDLYKLASPAPEKAPYYEMGCYKDVGAHHRALPELWADDWMTPEMCAGFAARRGFKQFGVEYGRECWAGPELDPLATVDTGCYEFPCAGNDALACGGRLRLLMYSYDINDVESEPSTPVYTKRE